MGAARAKLVIEVDDKDVAAAEKSVQRLNKAVEDSTKGPSSATNSLGGRKPVESEEQQRRLKAFLEKDTPAAAKKSEEAMKSVAKESDNMSGSLGKIPVAGAAAGAAIAAVAVVVVAAGAAMYAAWQKAVELAKAFADFAIEAGNVAEKTGLAVETIVALRQEADAQGRSFSEMESAVASFRKTVGEAAAGNDKARQSLSLLGIDGKKAIYDIDGAFKQALKSIVAAPNPIDQARKAFAVFGSEWPKILPFIKAFNGDVDATIRKAEELGMIVGGPNVDAAREFNRAYEEMNAAIKGVSLVLGRELMPIVAQVFRDFNSWITSNRATIASWATSIGNFTKGVIGAFQDILKFVNENPLLIRILTGVVTGGASELARSEMGQRMLMSMNPLTAGYQAFSDYGSRTGGQTFGQPTPDPRQPDMAAIEAARAEADRLRKEQEAAAKADLAARIALFERAANQLGSIFDTQFAKITESFRETMDIGQYEAQFAALRAWYGDEIHKLVPAWESLVQQQTLAEKKGANERYLAKQEFDEKTRKLTDRTEAHETASAKAIADIRKRQQADYLKNEEDSMRRRVERYDAGIKSEIARRQQAHNLTMLSERELVDRINQFEMEALKKRRTELDKYLQKVLGDKDREDQARHELAMLDETITQQQITNANRVLDVEKKKQDAIKKLNDQYRDLKYSLEDQLDAVTRGNTPLTEYEKTLRQIQRNYRDLTEEQKRNLLAIAEQIDAVNELNRQHAEMKDFFKTTLKYAFEGDLKGLLKSFQDRMKESLIDNLSGMLATKVLGFDPNATNNPVAKPIVNSLKTTNKILNGILVKLGGSPIAGFNPTSGGGLGSIFGGGNGPGGTPMFNPNRFSGTSGGGSLPTGSIDADGNYVVNGNDQAGGIFGNLKSIFAPQKNILTGKDSKAAGVMGGIGSIAALVGGFVPGRAGKMLQYGGMGAQYGSMFGPWGAAIGAGIGALVGLFSGRDNAIKKLKEAAMSAYSISVNDRSVLSAMRDIGEAYYGKGQVGKNAMAVVGLHEVQELLRNYAQTSGQSSSRLDRDLYTDEHWSGNQFKGNFGGFRERGGPVMAGRAYVVGERRPELFIPNTSGTIMPSVPNVTVNSGIDPELIAALAESIYELKDQVAQLGIVDEGVIVKRGARAAGNELVAATAGRYNDSFSARENTARVLQYD